MRVTRAALVVLVAVAAGCSSGTSTPKAPVQISALETKAGLIGCSARPATLSVATDGCTFGSELLTLATFVTNDQRDLWLRAAKNAAGGIAVTGNGWAAVLADPDAAARLATALGGTVS